MTEKQNLALINFGQKIATARMTVALGRKLSYGESVTDLQFRIRQIRQLQRLFEHEYGKVNADLELLQNIDNIINTLINDYRLEGTNVLLESDILPNPYKQITLILSDNGTNTPTPTDSVNFWYGGGKAAWDSLEIALAQIPYNKRYGLTIGVAVDGEIMEYWWPELTALTDDDIQIKFGDDGFYYYDGNGGTELENKFILDANG